METTALPFLVGAYASLPADRAEQTSYYELLRQTPWISGLEIPVPGDFLPDPSWLVSQLDPKWQSTLTLIPGTMQNLGKDPQFGLASPDADGRQAALDFVEQVRQHVVKIAEEAGRSVFRGLELHSAPALHATYDDFARSLEHLRQQDWAGCELLIEHCDAPRAGQKPEKGFLELDQEIKVALNLEVGLHLNWGRSCLEDRDPEAPEHQIEAAGAAGVLRGVFYSGAGPEETQYGYAWIDGHLPSSPDEPTSLLTPERIADCSRLARDLHAAYLGAKICVPAQASLPERLGMLERIYQASLNGETGR